LSWAGFADTGSRSLQVCAGVRFWGVDVDEPDCCVLCDACFVWTFCCWNAAAALMQQLIGLVARLVEQNPLTISGIQHVSLLPRVESTRLFTTPATAFSGTLCCLCTLHVWMMIVHGVLLGDFLLQGEAGMKDGPHACVAVSAVVAAADAAYMLGTYVYAGYVRISAAGKSIFM
jgi:hypothetical protein